MENQKSKIEYIEFIEDSDKEDLTEIEKPDPKSGSRTSKSTGASSPSLLPAHKKASTSTSAVATTITTVTYTIIRILECLFIKGVNSLSYFEKLSEKLSAADDVDPSFLQLVYALKQLLIPFLSKTFNELNEDKYIAQMLEPKEFHELQEIFKPLLKKKDFAERVYSSEAVEKVLKMAREIFLDEAAALKKRKSEDSDESDDCQNKKKRKNERSQSKDEDEDVAEDGSEDPEDYFINLFQKSKAMTKKLAISQLFQYCKDDERHKITTPGETGSHLIKIEITDTKDLKNCKSDKDYWRKVSKKAYFLLDIDSNPTDKTQYKNILKIVADVGQKLSTIENSKSESFTMDFKK